MLFKLVPIFWTEVPHKRLVEDAPTRRLEHFYPGQVDIVNDALFIENKISDRSQFE